MAICSMAPIVDAVAGPCFRVVRGELLVASHPALADRACRLLVVPGHAAIAGAVAGPCSPWSADTLVAASPVATADRVCGCRRRADPQITRVDGGDRDRDETAIQIIEVGGHRVGWFFLTDPQGLLRSGTPC